VASKTRLYFVTDVHGSDRCFRKFLNAGKFYKANVLVLGGDITGKMIVPIIDQGNGTYKCNYTGSEMTIKSKEEAEALAKTIRDSGYYPYFCEPKEVEEMNANKELVDKLFKRLMVEGVQGWMRLAEERLKGTGISCYISPGNDDIFEIDEVLSSSSYVINPEEKVVDIDGDHEMITLGYTNHTPWNSPREVDEEVLERKIEAMASKLKDPKTAIWNIHVPPIDTPIDQAPKLDPTLKPVISGGHMVMISAGSVATRKSIEKYQPLIGIHGHIHESKGIVKIGRTMCFNPGSEYGEGILRGLLCDLEGDKIKSYMLTSG
jgi:Icc-related predicted phosphoesterase